MRYSRIIAFALMALAAVWGTQSQGQAALLMEEPYGLFGVLNPTGHDAIYFERICAETPVKLRRCEPGELGSVIARYQGIDGYDWVAMPLIPYLYSVENATGVPAHVNREMVTRMRERYREQHLESLGPSVFNGNFVHGGWTQLVGVSYERRIYAFRFATTPEQDEAVMARLNAGPNRSDFNLLFNNCADFARATLNQYFPHTFRRSLFPDADMTTPKQVTWKLLRYCSKHPETKLAVFEIPQVPGYRRMSHRNKSIAGSLTTTGYAVPLALLHPYIAGALFVDYLARGRFPASLKHPQVLGPANLTALTLTDAAPSKQNPGSAGDEAAGAASADSQQKTAAPANPSL